MAQHLPSKLKVLSSIHGTPPPNQTKPENNILPFSAVLRMKPGPPCVCAGQYSATEPHPKSTLLLSKLPC